MIGEMVSLEVHPVSFDVVEFRGVFRQPFNGNPRTRSESSGAQLADVNRAVIENKHDRQVRVIPARPILAIQQFEQHDEIAAAFRRTGDDMQLTACCILRSQDRDLLRLSGCFDAQVCSTRSPYVSQVRMCQRFGFILEQQRQITGLGLLPEQVQSKSSPSDRIHLLPVLERVARPTPAKPPFLTITARNHDAEIC